MKSDPDQVGINEILVIYLLENIFMRLSVTSVGRCRCVCKSWYYSLTDSMFINDLHLNCSINRPPLKILAGIDTNKRHLYCTYRFIDAYKNYARDKESQFKFRIKEGEHKGRKVYSFSVGSCNGLVCLDIRLNKFDNGRRTIALWNPATKDCKIAPLTPLLDRYKSPSINQAFAYDHHNNDYKILRFVHALFYQSQHVDVYSLRSNSWVSLNDSAPPGLWIRSFRYTIYNGFICMVVSDTMRVDNSYDQPRISKIIEFRLMDNSFRCDLPMPPNLPSHADSLNYFDLKNIQGQLTAFQFYHSLNSQSKLKLWTLNEETRDWKMWMTISPMGYELGSTWICDFMEPLCMNLDGQLLIVFSSIASQGLTRLILFDTKTSTRSILGDFFPIDSSFPKGTRGYLGQMTYIESLVSPHLFEPNGKVRLI